jgi:hypothetical protein
MVAAGGDTTPVPNTKPQPRTSDVVTLGVLFLLGCVFYGYGDVHPAFGGVRYTQNIITVPAVPGAVRSTQPFIVTGDDELELLFAPNHPRPEDMPDEFTFDWTMVEVKSQETLMSGRVQFAGARVRRDPTHPPIAIVPVPLGLDGAYVVSVSPLVVGDWPDLEFYLVQDSDKRFVGFTLAGIFLAVFLALLAVVLRRYRAASRAWERLTSGRAGSSPSSPSGSPDEAASEQ